MAKMGKNISAYQTLSPNFKPKFKLGEIACLKIWPRLLRKF